MPLSIQTQPTSSLLSANNDRFFVLSGSSGFSSSVHDFKFIADVYDNLGRVTTLKTFPDPNYPGYGVFNLKNVVSNLVSFDFIADPTDGNIFHSASNSSVPVQVYFGREYVYNNAFTQSRGEVSSSVFHYINSSLPFLEQGTTNFDNYLVASGSSFKKFLTKNNSPVATYPNLRNFLYYYASSSVLPALNIKTYDNNNNQVGQYVVQNTLSTNNGVQIISTGYPQLSVLISGSDPNNYITLTGNPVMFNPAVSSYIVQLQGSANFPFSETVTYQIKQDCSRFAPYSYKAYWLNTLGGFDSWLLNKKNQVTSTKTQSTYKKIQGNLNSQGNYQVKTYSRATVPYFTQIQDKLDLSTDFLSDQQVLYLKDLFTSPVIFLEDPNGVVFSATVDTNDYVLSKRVNTKIYSLQLSFITSYFDFRQSQ